jgi:hypothetical protein
MADEAGAPVPDRMSHHRFARAVAGDGRDGNLWRDYSRVTRSLAAVRWSRGLHALMLGGRGYPRATYRLGVLACTLTIQCYYVPVVNNTE